MKDKISKVFAQIKNNPHLIKTVLLSIFFWQLFITLFWFSGSNLILLLIIGFINFNNIMFHKK